MTETASPVEDFELALLSHAPTYGVELNAQSVAALRAYFELLQTWNTRLHLVAPCSPAEFATRHVLESLLAIKYFPAGALVADIGSGGGLPAIPCLIVRPDIRATLIEASPKKAIFLREALRAVERASTAKVLTARFEEIPAPDAHVVTCRALDRFTASLSNIIRWSSHAATLLLFGGPAIQAGLEKMGIPHTRVHIPESEQRFIFII